MTTVSMTNNCVLQLVAMVPPIRDKKQGKYEKDKRTTVRRPSVSVHQLCNHYSEMCHAMIDVG